MSRITDRLIKVSKHPTAAPLSKETVYDGMEYYDTGNFMLNASICGDIFGGVPQGYILQMAGAESTGKSLMTTKMLVEQVKQGRHIILFESEGAFRADAVRALLTDEEKERFAPYLMKSVELMTTYFSRIIEDIEKYPEVYKDENIVVAIDSLGMLPSNKEVGDASSDKNTQDMTRARAVASFFRIFTARVFELKIPLIVVNHQYATMDAFNPLAESSGKKMAYANSITLSIDKKILKEETGKKKGEKKETIQVGATFTLKPKKSRFIAENISVIEVFSKFKTGLDRYSGLWTFLWKHKLVVWNASKMIYVCKDIEGFEYTKEELSKTPREEVYNKEVLEYINAEFKKRYSMNFGSIQNKSEDVKQKEPNKKVTEKPKKPVEKKPEPKKKKEKKEDMSAAWK